MLTNTSHSSHAKVSPLSWDVVKWKEGFWADAEKVNTEVTIPHIQAMFEDKDISHILENFRICAGEAEGTFGGTVFGDGDFYKWMEAAIYAAAKSGNQDLFEKLDEYIELIRRSQLEDGYISTKQIIGEREHNGTSRHGDINDFEVYNFGHLFTTACLHYRVTGKNTFLSIAEKTAEYLENLLKKSVETGDVQTAVCPSHYMGILELYRTTGKEKYLELAKTAIALRDLVKNGMDDNQDRIPLKKHEKIIGHAVRANYLYAGVADLYMETGEKEYLDVLHRVWNNLINQKVYLTGGCGALYNGSSPYGEYCVQQLIHQAYGYEYQLPNITAYNETCASVGAVMWAYRMFQIEPKAEYFDFIERTMMNVNLAAVSLDGKRYFYENMLRRVKKLSYELVWPLTRSEYIHTYCCPPNLARTLAEISEYAYTVSENTLWCGLYGTNAASIVLPNGTTFEIEQKTEYPYDGKITFILNHIVGEEVQVNLRIPGWVKKGTVCAGGRSILLTEKEAGSYLGISVKGENAVIEVDFDMTVRCTVSHPYVEENCNQVAVERGPLVYCIESEDCEGAALDDLLLSPMGEFKEVPFTIQGRKMTALSTEAYAICRGKNYVPDALYQTWSFEGLKKVNIRMIPYFAWDNRTYGEMRIWMPVIYQ